MNIINIYIDEDDKLSYYQHKNNGVEALLKGQYSYDSIKELSYLKILDINERKKDLIVEYDDCVLKINDYNKVFFRRGTADLRNSIIKYFENQQLKKIKHKKVKRKNKHKNKKIVMIGIGLLMGGIFAISNVDSKNINNNNPSITVEANRNENKLENQANELINKSQDINTNEKTKITLKDSEMTIHIDYTDRSNATKPDIVRSNYSQLITKYSKMYGLDSELVTAIAAQESLTGIHTTHMDPGGATGLMQIQNSVWLGNSISAYNFELGKNETVNITLEKIQDAELNIKIGCMILQDAMKDMNYNTLAALQCYNMGYGNMNKILTACSIDTNRSIDEILNDVENTEWMNYRNIIKVGDSEYVEHVLSWIGNDLNIRNIKKDGTLVSLNIETPIKGKIY